MRILAIDPGWSVTGWEVTVGAEIIASGHFTPKDLVECRIILDEAYTAYNITITIIEVPMSREDIGSHYFGKNAVAAMKCQALAWYLVGYFEAIGECRYVTAREWQGNRKGGAAGEIEMILKSQGLTVKNEHERDAIGLALWAGRRVK